MHIMSTNFDKTLVWKHDCDIKLWRHKQRTPSTNDYHMPLSEAPHENFLRTPLQEIINSNIRDALHMYFSDVYLCNILTCIIYCKDADWTYQ